MTVMSRIELGAPIRTGRGASPIRFLHCPTKVPRNTLSQPNRGRVFALRAIRRQVFVSDDGVSSRTRYGARHEHRASRTPGATNTGLTMNAGRAMNLWRVMTLGAVPPKTGREHNSYEPRLAKKTESRTCSTKLNMSSSSTGLLAPRRLPLGSGTGTSSVRMAALAVARG